MRTIVNNQSGTGDNMKTLDDMALDHENAMQLICALLGIIIGMTFTSMLIVFTK